MARAFWALDGGYVGPFGAVCRRTRWKAAPWASWLTSPPLTSGCRAGSPSVLSKAKGAILFCAQNGAKCNARALRGAFLCGRPLLHFPGFAVLFRLLSSSQPAIPSVPRLPSRLARRAVLGSLPPQKSTRDLHRACVPIWCQSGWEPCLAFRGHLLAIPGLPAPGLALGLPSKLETLNLAG